MKYIFFFERNKTKRPMFHLMKENVRLVDLTLVRLGYTSVIILSSYVIGGIFKISYYIYTIRKF